MDSPTKTLPMKYNQYARGSIRPSQAFLLVAYWSVAYWQIRTLSAGASSDLKMTERIP